MRVMWWEGDRWPGITGARILTLELIRGLRDRGHEFVIVADRAEGEPEEGTHDGIPILRFPFHRALAERDMSSIGVIRTRLARLRRDLEPEAVHLHSLLPHAFFLLGAFRDHASRLLITRHSISLTSEGRSDHALPLELLRSADRIVCCSRAVLAETRRWAPEAASRTCLVHNGLPLPDLAPAPLPFDPLRLLCLGRLVDQKGFDVALEALAMLLPEHPGVRLVVGGDGPERVQLRRRAAALGIEAAVDFRGWIAPSRVPEVINACSLVLVPSRDEEGFGLMALQGAQMARPVVASRIGGLPEVVMDGKTGTLVEPGEPEALAAAVAALLQDPARMEALGRAGRRRARKEFGLERFVDGYAEIYAWAGGAGRAGGRRTVRKSPHQIATDGRGGSS